MRNTQPIQAQPRPVWLGLELLSFHAALLLALLALLGIVFLYQFESLWPEFGMAAVLTVLASYKGRFYSFDWWSRARTGAGSVIILVGHAIALGATYLLYHISSVGMGNGMGDLLLVLTVAFLLFYGAGIGRCVVVFEQLREQGVRRYGELIFADSISGLM